MTKDQYQIRIGYACLNNDLRDFDIFTSRSLILKTAESKGLDYVRELINQNVDDLMTILIYNESHGIRFYRLSSCIFPHLGNPQLIGSDYDLDFVKKKLKACGLYAKTRGHRITMHPPQFIQIGAPDENVLKQTFVDLINHANLFKAMGLSPADGSVMIIHGGGTYGDKVATLQRWKENFRKLPPDVQQYIALENDENSYGIMDLLPVCEELNIPFCIDIFHNRVSKNRIPITKSLMRRVFNTWKRRNIVPKLHFSNQEPGLRKGAHSKTITRVPFYLLQLPYLFHTNLDIMLEVKDKEVSVFKFYYKFFQIQMEKSGRVYYRLKPRVLDKILAKNNSQE